jgi:hypothetical protein
VNSAGKVQKREDRFSDSYQDTPLITDQVMLVLQGLMFTVGQQPVPISAIKPSQSKNYLYFHDPGRCTYK